MKARIYVAGASKEPKRCRAAMELVQRAGLTLTLDWLESAGGVANDSALAREDRWRHATDDLDAVRCANAIWVLAPENTSVGCWVELGYAVGIRVVSSGEPWIAVSGPAQSRSIFSTLADFASDSDIEALNAILERYEGR